MAFLDDNYLITNETGKRIFNAVKDLPVIDPHNHADVKEIADNNCYSNAWQLFAATDHYVWELLRKRGVPEELITGKADPRSKFLTMAKVFPETAGNPLYEWIHLDLRRYFGIDLLLNEENGPKIWEEVNAKLATDAFRPQALLTGPLNVEAMSSTDDLIDTLENHDRARAAHILPDEKMRRNWTAFLFFQRGLTLVYNGQEVDNPHVPSLFDKDPIHWDTGRDQSAFLAHLAELKRDAIFAEGSYTLTALPHDVLLAVYEKDGRRMAGLFSLRGESALVRFPAPNGVYRNCIDGSPVEIYEEQLAIHGEPIVLAF